MILRKQEQMLLHPVPVVHQDCTLCHILYIGDRIIGKRLTTFCLLHNLIECSLAATDIVPHLVCIGISPTTERDVVPIHTADEIEIVFRHHPGIIAVTQNLLRCVICRIPQFIGVVRIGIFHLLHQVCCCTFIVICVKQG